MRQLLLLIGLVFTYNFTFAQITTSEISVEAVGEVTSIDGKVGIGTDDPIADLHIRDNTARLFIENINGSGTGWTFLRLKGTGANFWDLAQFGDNDFLEFRPKGSGNNRFMFHQDGKFLAPRIESTTGIFAGNDDINDFYEIRPNDQRWFINGDDRMLLKDGTLWIKGKTAVYSDFVGYSGETLGFLPNGKEPTLVITEDIVGTRESGVGGQLTYRGGLSFGRGGPGIYAVNMNPAGSSHYGEIRFHTTYWNGSQLANADRMVIKRNGNVGIGILTPGYKLDVNGSLNAQSLYNSGQLEWSDFVFAEDYALPSLVEVEQHIIEKGHLKDIPSEAEVLDEGYDLGNMDSKLLQKIEELTLYLIEQNKKIERLESEIIKLKGK